MVPPMDPRFASYAISSHWPYLDAHLELTRQPAVRRALWLLAQLQVDVDGAPVLLGPERLGVAGLTRGEAQWIRATLAELEGRRVVVRYAGAGRRPAAWSFRGPIAHWRGFGWRRSGARAIAKVVEDCASSRFCESRCNFATGIPDQGPYRLPPIVLATPAHLFPSGETLPGFGRKVAPPVGKSPAPVGFVPVDPVDSLQLRAGDLAPSPISGSSIEEPSISLDRQNRIDALQGAFRAAGGGEIFRASRRWADLESLAGEITDEQCAAIVREIAQANVRRDFKLKAPLLLDRARELTKAPAIRFLGDVASTS